MHMPCCEDTASPGLSSLLAVLSIKCSFVSLVTRDVCADVKSSAFKLTLCLFYLLEFNILNGAAVLYDPLSGAAGKIPTFRVAAGERSGAVALPQSLVMLLPSAGSALPGERDGGGGRCIPAGARASRGERPAAEIWLEVA